jgi:hypothetical protein
LEGSLKKSHKVAISAGMTCFLIILYIAILRPFR